MRVWILPRRRLPPAVRLTEWHLVVITGGHENGLRCNVSTCCAAFAERIVGSVEA